MSTGQEVEAWRAAELDAATMYGICRLRQDVFVLEQECLYADLDGRDLEPGTVHLVLRDGTGDVVGTARLLDDAPDDPVWRIGRVVLAKSTRGRGLADPLVRAAVAAAMAADPARDIVLGAQSPLAGWYAGFGFVRDGDDYVEDDIPHTPMRLRR